MFASPSFFIRTTKNMNTYLSLNLVLLSLLFMTACNGQIEADPVQDEPTQAEEKVSDYDPYFVKSTAITSPYGPSSITRSILEDRQGDLWFATWEGIIRYDGKAFTNFTNKEGLRRFHAFTILEDKAGNLWFGTIGAGVYHYDSATGAFTNFTTKEGLASDRIACFYEDRKGHIWIGTDGGISVYDGQSFRNFTTDEGLTNKDVNSIIEDENGKFWIGTRGEACVYDGTSFTMIRNVNGLAFTNVRSVIKDTKGNIWLGGNDGLWRFDGLFYTNMAKQFVGFIYEDQKGNIWTSSESPDDRRQWMLSRYEQQTLSDEKATATTILQQENMFFGIVEDQEGGIWLGSLNGVCRYDGQSFNWFKETGAGE